MKKLVTLSTALLVILSASASANQGLEKAIKLQIDRANEEIQIIEDFKGCIAKSAAGDDMKACHASKKETLAALWASRSKK